MTRSIRTSPPPSYWRPDGRKNKLPRSDISHIGRGRPLHLYGGHPGESDRLPGGDRHGPLAGGVGHDSFGSGPPAGGLPGPTTGGKVTGSDHQGATSRDLPSRNEERSIVSVARKVLYLGEGSL